MPDVTTIERRAKDHPEVAEQEREQDQAAAEAIVHEEETPDPEPILVDGKQLAFEGMEVQEIHTEIPGTLRPATAQYFKLGELVRVEFTARVKSVKNGPKRDINRREQVLEPVSEIDVTEATFSGKG